MRWGKVVCWSTEAAISLKRVKIEEGGSLKIRFVSKFTAASRGSPGDSTALVFNACKNREWPLT